jgi:hypothetical protein
VGYALQGDQATAEAALRLVVELRRPDLLSLALPPVHERSHRPPRWRALTTFAKLDLLPHKAGDEEFAQALAVPEAGLRQRVLTRIGDFTVAKWGLGALLEALEDPLPALRLAAAKALASPALTVRPAPEVVRELHDRETDAAVKAALALR